MLTTKSDSEHSAPACEQHMQALKLKGTSSICQPMFRLLRPYFLLPTSYFLPSLKKCLMMNREQHARAQQQQQQ